MKVQIKNKAFEVVKTDHENHCYWYKKGNEILSIDFTKAKTI